MTDIATTPTSARRPASGPAPIDGERSRAGYVVFALACVAVAVFAPLPYLTQSMADLAEADVGLASHYAHQPSAIQLALIVHGTASGLALGLTPLQWAAGVRRRWPAFHRVTGRILAVAILVGAATGLVVAQVSYAGLSGTIGFSLLSVIWTWCCVKAVATIRAGDVAGHRRWVIRTSALTFAAVTLRVATGVSVVVLTAATDLGAKAAFDRAYVVMPFFSWMLNLAVVEWALRRGSRSERVDKQRVGS